MGDEKAAGQQPSDDQERAGTEGERTAGSIYSGARAPADPATGDDPGTPGSIYSGEPETDEPDKGDDDGPPDDGSIYSG